jgi:hypothetical protein
MMKKIFRNVLLATSMVVSFGPIYAYALDDLVVSILSIPSLHYAPEGQSSIVNIGVNTADIDAFVKISGESIEFNGPQSQGITKNGTGAIGNSLGEGISWGNSIETSAIGANVTTNFIGDQSVSATLDIEYERRKRCGRTNTEFELNATYSTYYPSIINVAYNTADIDTSVQIGKSYGRGHTENVSIESLHISTQAVGVNSVINVANTYQAH